MLLNHDVIVKNNVNIKYFPNIQFSDTFFEINNNIKTGCRNITKRFQWHKLHIFNMFFKQWSYIFYIDCGMTIFSDISTLLNERKSNTLLAHSDAYPTYEWKLNCQFDKTNVEYFTRISNTYDLDIDYFQTGMLLFDTNIIEANTYDNLYNLALEYPISKTNEQGIISLYFIHVKPLWKQITIKNSDTYFYDCLSRNNDNKYIMLKIC